MRPCTSTEDTAVTYREEKEKRKRERERESGKEELRRERF